MYNNLNNTLINIQNNNVNNLNNNNSDISNTVRHNFLIFSGNDLSKSRFGNIYVVLSF